MSPLVCTPHPQKEALNNEKCHLCKMQWMSMPACECALSMFLCVHTCVYMRLYCAYLKMGADLQIDGGVGKGVSAYGDVKGGLFVI